MTKAQLMKNIRTNPDETRRKAVEWWASRHRRPSELRAIPTEIEKEALAVWTADHGLRRLFGGDRRFWISFFAKETAPPPPPPVAETENNEEEENE